jgi:hypothetical protein
MKKTVPVLLVVAFLAATSILQAQSLADAAEKERQRREEISESPEMITNDAVAGFSGGSVSTASPDSGSTVKSDADQAEQKGEATEEATEKANSEEPTDFEGRPESYWRETMGAARKKVKDLEEESTVLTLRMNDLENKFYSIDDGFDRDSIQKEIQKTYYEIDLNKENLSKAKAELQDLEEEARKSGALPGWIE